MSQNFSPYQPVSGTYTSNGSANNVTLGFNPAFILVINESDGDTIGFWIEGMANAELQKVVDSGTGTTDLSFVTSNGITVSSGVVTFGTDAALNENTKVFRYFAI